MPDHTSQEIHSKKLHESYILHKLHISCTKILCPTSFIFLSIFQGFPNSGKGLRGFGNFPRGNFLSGSENLMRSDFDNSNLLQS